MCELLAVVRDEPFPLASLWPLVERVERFGIAGFGWGAAWVDGDGRLEAYRDLRAFRDDDHGRQEVGEAASTSVLVHLRRPSRLSTLTLADTQPFLDPDRRFAFAHNGDLRDVAAFRERYRREGRIHGRADSEVGARWLEDAWAAVEADPLHGQAMLPELHETFGGQANLGLLAPGGTAYVYAGNAENPVFAFRVGTWRIVSTGLYSLDRSFFRLVAPKATDRRLVRLGCVERLAASREPASAAGRRVASA